MNSQMKKKKGPVGDLVGEKETDIVGDWVAEEGEIVGDSVGCGVKIYCTANQFHCTGRIDGELKGIYP